jgi:hypothetical protein
MLVMGQEVFFRYFVLLNYSSNNFSNVVLSLNQLFHLLQAKVLEPLGASTIGSQFLEPDGISTTL